MKRLKFLSSDLTLSVLMHIIIIITGEGAQNVVIAAINQYRMDTCITFRERHALDIDYIFFLPGTGYV